MNRNNETQISHTTDELNNRIREIQSNVSLIFSDNESLADLSKDFIEAISEYVSAYGLGIKEATYTEIVENLEAVLLAVKKMGKNKTTQFKKTLMKLMGDTKEQYFQEKSISEPEYTTLRANMFSQLFATYGTRAYKAQAKEKMANDLSIRIRTIQNSIPKIFSEKKLSEVLAWAFVEAIGNYVSIYLLGKEKSCAEVVANLETVLDAINGMGKEQLHNFEEKFTTKLVSLRSNYVDKRSISEKEYVDGREIIFARLFTTYGTPSYKIKRHLAQLPSYLYTILSS